MKTRIISGVAMGGLFAVILTVGFLWSSWVITVFAGLLAVGAVYELLHNVAKITSKSALIGAFVYTFLSVMLFDEKTTQKAEELENAFLYTNENAMSTSYWKLFSVLIGMLFVLYCVVVILKNHTKFSLASIVSLVAFPPLLATTFGCLANVINHNDGLYYLLMLFNFACVCDMGAYFIGVKYGKNKLCPEISPKKTVEGAVGGILSSIVFSFLLLLIFSRLERTFMTLVLTIPLCIMGMLGDLFASSIKRSVGLKDYSNLIPGHGGILDRFDSILFVAPVLYLYIMFGVM